MATTINTYLARVKLLTAATLADLEKAVNDYIDVTTVRDAPKPTSLYTATISIVGSTTTD